MTAIRLEYEAVLQVDARALPRSTWQQHTGPSGLPVAFRPFLAASGSPLRVAVAVAPDMGATAAMNTLLPLVEQLQPRCIAMCGVCAGRRHKLALGDVVAADKVYFHDTGKQVSGSVQQDLSVYKLRDDWKAVLEGMDPVAQFRDEAWFHCRPLTTELRQLRALVALRDGVREPWTTVDAALTAEQWGRIVGALREHKLLSRSGRELTAEGHAHVDDLLFQRMNRVPDGSPADCRHPFRLHVAPIGSGTRVIEDEQIWSFVSQSMRKSLGIEMEAAVLGELAHRQRQHRLDWIVMKGVMDFADHGRDDHFKEFAARASAECLLWFLCAQVAPHEAVHAATSSQRLPAPALNASRLDEVLRLSREAHEKLVSDPLSAAVRASHAIDHLADYLYERELGPTAEAEPSEAKLRRVEAKQMIPRLVATHLSFVQLHTSAIIQGGGLVGDPAPDLLRPCLDSLSVVVDWLFRDYLNQAPMTTYRPGAEPSRSEPPIPDATPINSTIGTVVSTGARSGTELGKVTPIWRHVPTASIVRLEAADGDATEQAVFRVAEPDRVYFLGRTARRRDGTANDFVVPKAWGTISRDQATLVAHAGGTTLTNTSNKLNVVVRGELVPRGAARSLRHGDVVQLSRYVGTFVDGRYYAGTQVFAVDRRTGLLSRAGLVAEIAGALATGAPRTLLILRCSQDTLTSATEPACADPERLAATVALALHRHDPSIPVARLGMDIAVLLASEAAVTAFVAASDRAIGTRCMSGFVALNGTSEQAVARLEGCLGALSRIAIAGRDLAWPVDLTRYALVPTSLDEFEAGARLLFAHGGGAVLFILGELARLEQMLPEAVPVLELELLELLGSRMGPREIVTFAGRGLLLFAMPGDVERFADEIGIAWHARGSVIADAFEIDRSLSTHLLARSELRDLPARMLALARTDAFALSASGLPAPLALAARAADERQEPQARARALVHVAEVAWKLLATMVHASARGLDPRALASDELGVWPGPWRVRAREAAHRLLDQSRAPAVPHRMLELAAVAASADGDGALRVAMETIAAVAAFVAKSMPDASAVERTLPRLERAIREVLASFAPLRGWTLIAIVEANVVDVDGTTQRIDYVDYTGPTTRGSQQCITVMGFRALPRFVHLVRWNEGLAIALEPNLRRSANPATGSNDLFMIEAPIVEPGTHLYRSIDGAHLIELPVTSRQLGIVPKRRATDDATNR